MRFPRPAILRGRDGAERWPQAADVELDAAVLRSLRVLDPSLTLNAVREAIGIHEDEDVLRARNATIQARPTDVLRFFRSQLRPIVPAQPAARAATTPIRSAPGDDPYGF